MNVIRDRYQMACFLSFLSLSDVHLLPNKPREMMGPLGIISVYMELGMQPGVLQSMGSQRVGHN